MNQLRKGRLLLTGACLALTSVLVFLSAKTRQVDHEAYIEDLVALRQLKQIDAQWELDTLKLRMGLHSHYDYLADSLLQLRRLHEGLVQRLEESHDGADNAPLQRRVQRLGAALEDKARLMERFKSHNSVLRNSLAFLPLAEQEVTDVMGQAQGVRAAASDPARLEAAGILRDVLVNIHTPSDERTADLKRRLDALAQTAAHRPGDVGAALEIFVLHARKVVAEQPQVDDLLYAISNNALPGHVDKLDTELSTRQRDAETLAARYSAYVLGFATALAALLVYAGLQLLRSHHLVRRMNAQLQDANAELERRVQERTHELQETQKQLLVTAREAGKAEIANDVLHNVGNVLNSLNASATVLDEKLRASRVKGLGQVAAVVGENAHRMGEFVTADERGRALAGYLTRAASALAEENRQVSEEVACLRRSIDHVKEIVAAQQSFAGSAVMSTPEHIADLLDEALRLNAAVLQRHQVSVSKEVQEMPHLMLDRSRILQILVNLIRNAGQALDAVAEQPRSIQLRAFVAEQDGRPHLQVCVADTGAGISDENLVRIFAHGFTTRKGGHGFGLHSCALAAREMGGTLTAWSAGVGLGATFTLGLPYNPQEAI